MKATLEQDAIAVRRIAEKFLAAYNSADLETLCGLLTEGTVLMPPNEPPVTGIEEVRLRFDAFFQGFTFTIKFFPQQTDLLGDLAFERGSYEAFALLKEERGAPRGGFGEYLLLFERQKDGAWKIAAFGSAAAVGEAPQTIVGPERLTEKVEEFVNPQTIYWRDRWAKTLEEYYPTDVPAAVRSKGDN